MAVINSSSASAEGFEGSGENRDWNTEHIHDFFNKMEL